MTNSPPVSVHEKGNASSLAPYTVLSSGIDTLYLNYKLTWENMNFLNSLKEYREEAKASQQPVLIMMQTNIPDEAGVFMVKPFGSGGYAYLLTSDEYALKFVHPGEDSGDTLTRPPLNAEFHSLLLHAMGSKAAESRLQNLLSSAGAVIHSVHVSRVDMFCDILLPESEWGEFIKQQLVGRAKDIARYDSGKLFSGFSIGRGVISARFYDKPLEVIKSGKSWMYEEWGIPVGGVPEGMRIIRVEFQLRREKIKELGIDTFIDLKAYIAKLWAYCTQEWLKVMDNPGKHTTRRKILHWWEAVQNGFLGLPAGKHLI
ncbi:MAG TPA: hypothetical protein PKI17_06355, partial [Syntrophomonas sp.]|nr:hypothetical protein [Syntrophomonas sp.]